MKLMWFVLLSTVAVSSFAGGGKWGGGGGFHPRGGGGYTTLTYSGYVAAPVAAGFYGTAPAAYPYGYGQVPVAANYYAPAPTVVILPYQQPAGFAPNGDGTFTISGGSTGINFNNGLGHMPAGQSGVFRIEADRSGNGQLWLTKVR